MPKSNIAPKAQQAAPPTLETPPTDAGVEFCAEVARRIEAVSHALEHLAAVRPPAGCNDVEALRAARLALQLDQPLLPALPLAQSSAVDRLRHRFENLAQQTGAALNSSVLWTERQLQRLALAGHTHLLHLQCPRLRGAMQQVTLVTDHRSRSGEDAIVVEYGRVAQDHPARATLEAIAARVPGGGFRLFPNVAPVLVLGVPYHRELPWRWIHEATVVRETIRWQTRQAQVAEQERREREVLEIARQSPEEREIAALKVRGAELEARVAELEAQKKTNSMEPK